MKVHPPAEMCFGDWSSYSILLASEIMFRSPIGASMVPTCIFGRPVGKQILSGKALILAGPRSMDQVRVEQNYIALL